MGVAIQAERKLEREEIWIRININSDKTEPRENV
jgi:hypothetical protein